LNMLALTVVFLKIGGEVRKRGNFYIMQVTDI
jgi:hypothetical protein